MDDDSQVANCNIQQQQHNNSQPMYRIENDTIEQFQSGSCVCARVLLLRMNCYCHDRTCTIQTEKNNCKVKYDFISSVFLLSISVSMCWLCVVCIKLTLTFIFLLRCFSHSNVLYTIGFHISIGFRFPFSFHSLSVFHFFLACSSHRNDLTHYLSFDNNTIGVFKIYS